MNNKNFYFQLRINLFLLIQFPTPKYNKISYQILLNEEEKALVQICLEDNHISSIDRDKLTYTDAVIYEIHTENSIPTLALNLTNIHVHKDEVNQQITKML